MLREIAAIDSRVTVVKLRRNFGQTAGWRPFRPCRGEYITHGRRSAHDPATSRCSSKIARAMTLSAAAKNRVDNFCCAASFALRNC